MVIFSFEARKKCKDRDSIIDIEMPVQMSNHRFSNGIKNADRLEKSKVPYQMPSPQYIVCAANELPCHMLQGRCGGSGKILPPTHLALNSCREECDSLQ